MKIKYYNSSVFLSGEQAIVGVGIIFNHQNSYEFKEFKNKLKLKISLMSKLSLNASYAFTEVKEYLNDYKLNLKVSSYLTQNIINEFEKYRYFKNEQRKFIAHFKDLDFSEDDLDSYIEDMIDLNLGEIMNNLNINAIIGAYK